MKTKKSNKPPEEKDDHGKSQAKAQLSSIIEMVQALEEAEEKDDDKAREEAETTIQEDALSVEVRSDWHEPGRETDKPTEYMILLCTGGPAVQIVGRLSKHGEPESAMLQYQDWGTPWTEYRMDSDEEAAVVRYAQCFYFGG
jgi:hypothetical protein